ncbi:MAG: holo-ACP synthase [Actinomycetia bacterium]|nr:holo-ACP synthase [Actinomycetes bacterium]
MIVGIGVDVVSVSRFAAALARTPAIADRLFTPEERLTLAGAPRGAESLAARFAAKEALAKALGAPGGMRWTDAEVVVARGGRPALTVRGTVASRARALGVTAWHLSLSHDGGVAIATVIAENTAGEPAPAEPRRAEA